MAATEQLEKRTIRRVTRRLVPFLILIYFIGYLDRSNISFAKLQMSDDLQLTATMFGLASGIFFIGYVAVEVPSNVLLQRFGARKWIARIMVTWGIVASLLAFAPNFETLLVLRFLLGIAEAGLYPGILLYLTYWIPKERRARVIGQFLLAIPLASVIGAPLSTWIMQAFTDLTDITGWRAMFFVQGLPAVIIAVVVWFYLTDRPSQAKWLRDDEREWLSSTMEREENETVATHGLTSLKAALLNP